MVEHRGELEGTEISSTTKDILARMLTCDMNKLKGMSTIEFMAASTYCTNGVIDELVQLGYIVEPQDEIKLSELDISSKLRNPLHRAGMRYLSQVAAYSKEELLNIRNIGIAVRQELLSVCEVYGIKIWSDKEMPIELKKCGLHPNLYGKWYDRGIVGISDLAGKTPREIEELCEGDKEVAVKISKMLKKNSNP